MKGQILKIFLDLETTGTDVKKHSIHQIAGMVEIDGEVVEKFNYKVRPHPKAKIEKEALRVGGVTEEQILKYEPMEVIYKRFIKLLGKYINKYDKKDKAYVVGFNNRGFGDIFLRAWFKQNGDLYYGSWFWADSLDVLVLASQHLIGRRVNMKNFKLKTVATTLGIEVEEERLHDAYYDVELARNIYEIVTGLDLLK